MLIPFLISTNVLLHAAALAAEPAAPPVEQKRTADLVKPYGHFQGTVIGAKGGLESFNSANMSAPTAAGNPLFLGAIDNDPATSFQAVQSRVGLKVNEGGAADGQIEIDFVGFDKSSPTTTAVPRLRIAAVGWNIDDKQRLLAGQTWDMFGGNTNPTHYNWVGAHFRAGNVGFLRHQIQYLFNMPALEVGLAAGLPAANITSDVGNIEGGLLPSFAGRVAYKGKAGRIGVSGIYANPKYTTTSPATERRASYGALAYYDVKLAGGLLNLSGELYYGQNLADIGTLALGEGRQGKSIQEAGGWLQATATFSKHKVYLAGGFAGVINYDDVLPGYGDVLTAQANADGTVTTKATRTRKTIGIKNNLHVRPGYGYMPVERLTLFVEPIFYLTTHQLAAAENASFDETRLAYGAQIGTALKF